METLIGQQLSELKAQEKQLLSKLSYIYLKNRDLTIKGEEIIEDLSFYVAPMVQHRDALDHILRAYSGIDHFADEDNGLEFYKKLLAELEHAYSHECRAFFDIADYISIKVRFYINEGLKRISSRNIVKIWDDYIACKKDIYAFCEDLAQIRNTRATPLWEGVNKYCEYLDKLFNIYKRFKVEIEPLIRGKFFYKYKMSKNTKKLSL